jgi:hypothetical protein
LLGPPYSFLPFSLSLLHCFSASLSLLSAITDPRNGGGGDVSLMGKSKKERGGVTWVVGKKKRKEKRKKIK